MFRFLGKLGVGRTLCKVKRSLASSKALAWGLIASSIWVAGGARAQCTTYSINAGPGTYVAGTDSVSLGDPDEGIVDVAFPFAVSLYGNSYTDAYVSANGYLEFGDVVEDYPSYPPPFPSSEFFVPVIFAHWDDLLMDTGIFTHVSGSAGSRVFVVEWNGSSYTSGELVDFEVVFYENQSYFDIIYPTTDSGDGDVVGIQQSNGGTSTRYTTALSNGLSLRVDCADIPNAGSCCHGTNCTVVSQGTCAYTFTLGGVCVPNTCPPVPYDECVDAKDLTGTLPVSHLIVDGTAANPDTLTSALGTLTYYTGVWFTFTAPAPGYLAFTDSSANNSVVAAMAPDCDSGTAVDPFAFEVIRSAGELDRKTVYYGCTSAGETVKILIAGSLGQASGATVPYDLAFSFTPFAVPSNDGCAAAQGLVSGSFPYVTLADNYLASDEATDCPDGLSHGVWYTYTPSWTGYLGVAEYGRQQAAVAYRSGDCGTAPAATCVGHDPNQQKTAYTYIVPITAGQPVKVAVGSDLASPTPPVPLQLEFDLVPDECSIALPLPVPVSYRSSLLFATPSAGGVAGTCDPDSLNTRDLWYSVTLPVAGQYEFKLSRLQNSVVGQSQPQHMYLAIFDGCGGSVVACQVGSYVDDSTPYVDMHQTLIAGTYKIRVSATDPSRAAFQLDILAPSCPADFDNNNVVNVSDIFAFLRAWFAHDVRADIDGNSVVNVSDIFAFLRHWFAHC